MPDALYEPDGDLLVPTPLTVGPWDRGSQHGGAPSALLVWAIEAEPAHAPVQLARLTVELQRPVPLTPLQLSSEVVRPGRNVQIVRAVLRAGDVEVAVAHALRIRTVDRPVPDEAVPVEPPPPGPEHGRATRFLPGGEEAPGFHDLANDIRFVEGGFDGPGPAVAWIRLLHPVVAGHAVSPGMRAAAAADFGNGLSWVLPTATWIFVNPDLTLHLARLPRGEWIGMRSTTYPSADGIGMADTALFDEEGRIGRSVQSLLLDERS